MCLLRLRQAARRVVGLAASFHDVAPLQTADAYSRRGVNSAPAQGARRHAGLAPSADPITNRFPPNRVSKTIKKSIESVANDDAVSAGASDGGFILFKE